MRALAFGTPGPFRAKLNQLVVSGVKTATTGLLSEYELEDEELERVGEQLAMVDDQDRYIATVEITAVDVCRFDEVGLAHAVAEGEGWETIEDWRDDHREYWKRQGVDVDDATQVVALAFRLV
jgi:uncharacterized protein YhfF